MFDRFTDKQLGNASVVLVAISVLLGLFAYTFHQSRRILPPDQLLSSAINNALSTTGVTTYTVDSDNSQETKQSNDLRFVNSPSVHSTVNVVTNSGGKVDSETYGDTTSDFVRYNDFEGPTGSINPVVKGIWSQVTPEKDVDGKLLTDTLSSSNILMANFDSSARQQFIGYLTQNNVYVSKGVTATRQKIDDHTATVVKVAINPGGFTQALKKYLGLLGLKNSATQIPDNTGVTTNLSAEFAIDTSSKKIVKIGIPTLDAARAVHFTSWDKTDLFPKPTSYMTYDELQDHLIVQKQ